MNKFAGEGAILHAFEKTGRGSRRKVRHVYAPFASSGVLRFFLFLFVLCIIRFQRVPFPTTLKQIGQPNQFSLT